MDGTIQSRSDDAPTPSNSSDSSLTLAVAGSSNRLSSVLEESSSTTRTYAYDASGNTISDGTHTFTYNDAGRMVSSTAGSATTNYFYNAFGQRVKKSGPGGTSLFAYDEAGHLLGVYDATGARVEELVWLGDIPVGTIRTSPAGGVGFFYIHSDNLNTPVRITRQEDNAVMWRWDHDPYGGGSTNDDADANGAFVFFDLRFPGQYFDSETGLNYNYFRDYDPATGRYDESDSLGDPRGLLTADEAYQHYLGGTGTPMRMAFTDIDTSGVRPSSFAAVQAAVTSAKQTKKEGCCTPSTTPIDDRQPFTTGGSNFLLLGNITLRLQGTFVVRTDCTWTFDGTLKSFDDRYDFNASTHRGPIAEWLTSRGREANGTPFWIEIRGAKPAKESGKL